MAYINISQIKLIYIINAILGTTPPFTFGKLNKPSRKIDIYVVFVITFTATIAGLSIKGRFNNTYPFTANATDMLLDFLSYTSLSLSNIIISASIRLMQPHKMLELLNDFQLIDSQLRFRNDSVRRRYYVELLFYGILFWTWGTYTFTFWQMAVGVDGNWPYYFPILQKFQLIALGLLVHNIALAFFYRFRQLNERLAMCESAVTRYAINMQLLNQLHKKLLLMFRTFNQIFGKAILCLCMNYVLGCLHPINSTLLQIMKGNVLNGASLHVSNFPLNYVCITTLLTLNTLVYCVPIAKSCHRAAKEAYKTHDIVQHTLKEINKKVKKENNLVINSLTMHLKVIQDEATAKYPELTAADFYVVDHSVLLGLLGVITSYLIILIQINLAS